MRQNFTILQKLCGARPFSAVLGRGLMVALGFFSFIPLQALEHAVIWHSVIGEDLALSGAFISSIASDELVATTFTLPSATLDNDLFTITNDRDLHVANSALLEGSYSLKLHVSNGSSLRQLDATIRVVAGRSQPKIAGGEQTSYAIAQDGTLYSWGYGLFGSLGQGDESNRTSPTVISASHFGSDEVLDLVGGSFTTFAITRSGAIYGMGRNHAGQLALGDQTNRSIPTQVASNLAGKRVVRAVSNELASLFLVDDGSIYAAGSGNSNGVGSSMLTLPTWIVSSGPLATSGPLLGKLVISFGRTRQGIAMVTADGELYGLGRALGLGLSSNETLPQFIQTGVKQFFLCDFDTGFMLGADDLLYITGEGAGGRLGNGSFQDITGRFESLDIASKSVYKLDTGYYSTIALMSDGTLYGFGDNRSREAVRASGFHSNPVQETTSFSGQLRSVRLGIVHAILLTSTGDLYTVGSNAQGQLGDGTNNSTTSYINLSLNLGSVAEYSEAIVPSETTLSSAISSFDLTWQTYEVGSLLAKL